jgi:hypothetical protein
MAFETQFYLQFPDDAGAERISGQLRADGFDVQAGPSPYGGDGWTVVARIGLTDADLAATETRLRELAASAGGSVDGYDKLLR